MSSARPSDVAVPSVLFAGKVHVHQGFIQVRRNLWGRKREGRSEEGLSSSYCAERRSERVGEVPATLHTSSSSQAVQRRLGLAIANCYPQAICSPLKARQGNCAVHNKEKSQVKSSLAAVAKATVLRTSEHGQPHAKRLGFGFAHLLLAF